MRALERIRTWGWWVALPLLMGVLIVLFFFEPTQFAFYPKCLLHQWTGLSCPGCGALRAGHQLLHGHFVEAFRFNPLLITMLPIFAWMTFREVMRRYHGKVYPSPFENIFFGWILTGIVILFGITRNLPYPAFAWMTS